MLDRKRSAALAHDVVRAFGANRLLTYASAVAFRSLVALIPLTLLGIALLGTFGQQRVWDRTLGPPIHERVLPPVYNGIDATVQRIFEQRGWLLIAFASALSIWDVSSAVRTCMSGLNEIFGTSEDERSPLLRYVLSLALALAVIVCIVGAALLLTAGAHLVHSSGGAWRFAFGVLRWPAAVVLLGLAIGLIVRYAPFEPPPPRWASAGTIVIVVFWLLASLVFRWFVASVADYRSGAGVLAAFLVLTTYVYTSAIIFMVGAQLDELLRGPRG